MAHDFWGLSFCVVLCCVVLCCVVLCCVVLFCDVLCCFVSFLFFPHETQLSRAIRKSGFSLVI